MILPGYLFIKGYTTTIYNTKIISIKPIDEITFSIIPGLFLHVLAGNFIGKVSDFSIDLQCVYALVTTTGNSLVLHIQSISENIRYILTYNIVLCLISYSLGHFLRELIRLLKLDIHFRFFRFTNNWYYLFQGERVNFPEFRKKFIHYWLYPNYIYVDALTESDDKAILYQGVVTDFTFDENGKLDNILIKKTKRREYCDHKKSFVKVDGDEFLIPFKKITNLNISYKYIRLVEKKRMDDKLIRFFRLIKSNNPFLYLTMKTIKYDPSIERVEKGYIKYLWMKYISKIYNFFLIRIPDSSDIIEISDHLLRIMKKSQVYIQLLVFTLIMVLAVKIGYGICGIQIADVLINKIITSFLVFSLIGASFQLLRYLNIGILRNIVYHILEKKGRVPENIEL
jgi:hypothetical protein